MVSIEAAVFVGIGSFLIGILWGNTVYKKYYSKLLKMTVEEYRRQYNKLLNSDKG